MVVILMSNLLLLKELKKHKLLVSEHDGVYLDELFQCVGCSISTSNNILSYRIYSSYNFNDTKHIESHDAKSNLVNNDTSYVYFIKRNIPVRFMLDSKKTKQIDIKNDKLRESLYNYK